MNLVEPTISVITVCYNSSATLGRALQSVVMQNWPKVEPIVIDGASTDNTPEILHQFGPKLACVVSEPDNGIYDAMNKGLSKAAGDIICFLNADDFYTSPTVLSQVAEQITKYDLDALIGDVAFFYPTNPDKIVRRYRSEKFHPDRLALGWMPAHPALFFTRSVVERVGYFKTDYQIAGDFEYIVRAFHLQALNYIHLPEILVKMQLGGASTAGFQAKIKLNHEVLRACKENGISTNPLKILSKYPAKLLEFVRR
jgi:glycosyltransferase involved in cell wall biosynthesis